MATMVLERTTPMDALFSFLGAPNQVRMVRDAGHAIAVPVIGDSALSSKCKCMPKKSLSEALASAPFSLDCLEIPDRRAQSLRECSL